MSLKEQFWSKDPEILYTNYLSFFPSEDLDITTNLNSIPRFAIYASLLLALYHKEPKYLFLSLIGFVISYGLYVYYALDSFDEILEDHEEVEGDYTKPTLNNPMMNVLLTDDPNRPPAYPVSDTSKEAYYVKKDMEEKLNFNLYRDVGDIYNNKHNQRQFYTMPNTQVPNDLNQFLDFVYRKDYQPICKENRFNCGKYATDALRDYSSPYIYSYEENEKNLR